MTEVQESTNVDKAPIDELLQVNRDRLARHGCCVQLSPQVIWIGENLHGISIFKTLRHVLASKTRHDHRLAHLRQLNLHRCD